MRKVFKKITASLTVALMLCGSTYATVVSANASDNTIQPRGTWAMYGDVNNDGEIDGVDTLAIIKAINKFEKLTGDSRLPLSYAVARPEVYYLTIPQAADIDGDNYITENDIKMLNNYCMIGSDIGRCGQPFYIN
ncbi:MAG: hypothetical protein K2G83_05785 [Ruminococcus sp.]|nr:hypothetical protein [Ruminococcus sp.]